MKILDGDLVRLARLSRGWTLQELADRSQVSVSYISHIENNRRKIPNAIRAVLDLDAETDWLFKLLLFLKAGGDLTSEDKDIIYEKLRKLFSLSVSNSDEKESE